MNSNGSSGVSQLLIGLAVGVILVVAIYLMVTAGSNNVVDYSNDQFNLTRMYGLDKQVKEQEIAREYGAGVSFYAKALEEVMEQDEGLYGFSRPVTEMILDNANKEYPGLASYILSSADTLNLRIELTETQQRVLYASGSQNVNIGKKRLCVIPLSQSSNDAMIAIDAMTLLEGEQQDPFAGHPTSSLDELVKASEVELITFSFATDTDDAGANRVPHAILSYENSEGKSNSQILANRFRGWLTPAISDPYICTNCKYLAFVHTTTQGEEFLCFFGIGLDESKTVHVDATTGKLTGSGQLHSSLVTRLIDEGLVEVLS